MSFVKPKLTDDELNELLEFGTLEGFNKTLQIYQAMKNISPDQSTALNEYRASFPVVMKRGGKRCRRTYRKRILNKDMKPMHKTMHKLRHRGRGGGKRRSCKKH